MPPAISTSRGPGAVDVLIEVDEKLYTALSNPVSPAFDLAVSKFTNLADHSKISVTVAAGLALAGPRGRAAAVCGLVAVAATSAVANLAVKPFARRPRPRRSSEHLAHDEMGPHHVRMPTSHSFPSGHTASAFAFATGVRAIWPRAGSALLVLAVAVGYSRVHTGVHYPGDVLLGALLGCATAVVVTRPIRKVMVTTQQ